MIYTGILDATWKSLKENIGNESSKTLITLMHWAIKISLFLFNKDEISSDKVIEDARGMISKEELNLDQSIDSLEKGNKWITEMFKKNEKIFQELHDKHLSNVSGTLAVDFLFTLLPALVVTACALD